MPGDKAHKRELFAQAIAKGKSDLEAFSEAGFSMKNRNSARGNASRLRNLPSVRARIEELMAKAAVRAVLKAEEVLRDIAEIKRRCMQETPVLDAEGNAIPGLWQFDAKNALKACELQGKYLGLWKERLDVVDATPRALANENPTRIIAAYHEVMKAIEEREACRLIQKPQPCLESQAVLLPPGSDTES